MLTWILVIALVFVGGITVYTLGRKRGRQDLLPAPAQAKALLERTLIDAKPGDILQHAGRDYLVEGVVRYDEDGYGWTSVRTVDKGEESWWLVAFERVPPRKLRRLGREPGVTLAAYPPDNLDVGGTTFQIGRRGNATGALAGDLGDLGAVGPSARCRWWSYTAGARFLLVEQWGETYRALSGEELPPEDVALLPGELTSLGALDRPTQAQTQTQAQTRARSEEESRRLRLRWRL